MIKYLREKIIGRPAVFSRAGDLPSDDNMPPINKANSENSLNDVMSISTISNDTTNTDRTPSQVEKLTATGSGGGISFGRRPVSSSSPIVIPKKPSRSNASSQSSSSYTSVADQMSSLESSTQSRRESEDGGVLSITQLPILPSTGQLLEHSAARDRISVKIKRRQPIKQKLSTLRENDDNEIDLFSRATEAISSTPEEEQPIMIATRIEPKIQQQQPLIDLSDLDTARARLRMSVRPRDRSADNILLAINNNNNEQTSPVPPNSVPTFTSSMQRSISFKRPQEINGNKLTNRPIVKPRNEEKKNDEIPIKPIQNKSAPIDICSHHENIDESTNVNNISPTHSMSRSSSQEHIYDNLDVFKRHKTNINSSSNEDEPISTTVVKTREHSTPTTRLRPVTMIVSANNDKQTTNEFENVFNQLKKRGSIRKVRPTEEIIPEPSPPAPVEEIPAPPSPPPPSQPENEPVIQINKPIETTPIPQTPNRRKTVGGVHLPASNKVATDDNKPSPSWIDIAKQKQSKFQSVSNEKIHHDETEEQQQQPLTPVAMRKQSVPSVDPRSSRKSMFEQPTNAQVIERDSIRALKAGNPNRINNLIQFFDK